MFQHKSEKFVTVRSSSSHSFCHKDSYNHDYKTKRNVKINSTAHLMWFGSNLIQNKDNYNIFTCLLQQKIMFVECHELIGGRWKVTGSTI